MDTATDAIPFPVLVGRYDAMVRAVAWRLLHDRDRTDDVVQETYERAWRALPRLRAAGNPGAWLCQIARNVCIDELRRRRRTERLVEEAAMATGADPAAEVADRSLVTATLGRLTPEQRAVVVLVASAGLAYEEAAAALGVPVGTVRSRLSRARRALRTGWPTADAA